MAVASAAAASTTTLSGCWSRGSSSATAAPAAPSPASAAPRVTTFQVAGRLLIGCSLSIGISDVIDGVRRA
ncbi:hypothetical protein [Geodermatophilus obscurus]|uniref:hypothetical protein n=1 Tax=Geodermatophilus obscurus TaxID=1861 RepID=UPI00019B7D77|nr:hypothetical protein [Geodermatophilus obscurus]